MLLRLIPNKYFCKNSFVCHFRWSTIVPLLFYTCFFFVIWTLTVPLKSHTVLKKLHQTSKNELVEIEIKHDTEIFQQPPNENVKNVIGKVNNNNNNNNNIAIDTKQEYDVKKNPTKILKEVFRRADTDNNKLLDAKELSRWINFKIKQHIAKAIRNNYGLFTLIDVNPRNGVVTWDEYHAYFLKQKGLSLKYVKNHDERKHSGLQRSLKEQIMRDKAYWQEAARFDPDSLTVDEFLAFTHPESSAANHLALVDELYERFDRDGDEILTEDEFATLQTDGNDETSLILLSKSEKERREEFKNSVDLNKDGRADRRELLRYVAPQNPRRSELEAQSLISIADIDHNDMLSLSEVLAHPDLFMTSKMVDTAKSFHDEF